MEVATLSTLEGNRLLPALRDALAHAESALLCTAFVSDAGVHLIEPQLRSLGSRARLLTTTVFGSTSPTALNSAHRFGVDVSVLNPIAGCYHPKLYVAISGEDAAVMLGSANLTGGLMTNVEAAALLRGRRSEPAIASAIELAELLWADARRSPWTPLPSAEPERLSDELYRALRREVARQPQFSTLGPKPQPNRLTEVTPFGVYVETNRTKRDRTGPQLVPAWMLQLAHDYLVEHGELSNAFLLSTDGLSVKRSSAVCAILARLPGVSQRPGPSIVLEYNRPPAPYGRSNAIETLSLAADRPKRRR